MVDVLIRLGLAAVTFLVARWLLALVGTPEPINLILSFVLALVVFATATADRLRLR